MEEPNRRTTSEDATEANTPSDHSPTGSGDDARAGEDDEALSMGRRLFLGTTGAVTLGSVSSIGAAATDDEEADAAGWVIEQGENCVPLNPLEDDLSAAEFYDWDEGETDYSSEGTTDLQEPETSLLFLYQDPDDEVYLVIVHEILTDENDELDGGSATFEFEGLPDSGSWIVRDDFYDEPSNFDVWDTDQDPQVVDWTWTAGRTDGGVFGPLGDVSEFTVVPHFNDEAELDGIHYDGDVEEWQVLSGDRSDPDRATLDMEQAVTIRRGSCDGDGSKEESTDEEAKEDEESETDEQDGSVLHVSTDCAVRDPAAIRITNIGNETVEVRDLDNQGDDMFSGRPTIEPGETLTLNGVPDGEYVLQAFVPGTEREAVGDPIELTVDCENPLDVQVRCDVDDPANVRITNQTGYTVEVRDIDGAGGDLLDGRPPLDPGDTMTLTGVPNGEYVVRAFVPGTESKAVGPQVTVTVDC